MTMTMTYRFVQDAELYPDVSHHQEAIESRYRIDVGAVHQGLARIVSEKQIVFVCFSNRSGSNLLIDTLGRLGFGCKAGDEFFNAEAVVQYGEKFGFPSFEDYLEFVIKLRGFRRLVFMKVGPHQLAWLANRGILGTYFPSALYVMVERADKASQAVSLYLADMTGSYMRLAEEPGERRAEVDYSGLEILLRLKRIIDTTAIFHFLFATHSIRAHVVRYEELDAAPRATLERMAAALSLENDFPSRWFYALLGGAPRILRQSDELNQRFVARFKREFAIDDRTAE